MAVFSIERKRLEIKFIVIVSPLLSLIIQNKMKQNKTPTKYRTQPFPCSSILNFGLGAEASRDSVNDFFLNSTALFLRAIFSEGRDVQDQPHQSGSIFLSCLGLPLLLARNLGRPWLCLFPSYSYQRNEHSLGKKKLCY